MESQKTSTKEGRQSDPIDDEEVEELYMDYDDQCPNCKLCVINEFYVKDYDNLPAEIVKPILLVCRITPTIEERSGSHCSSLIGRKKSTCRGIP